MFLTILGVLLAYGIVSLPISQRDPGMAYLFLSGAMAICAMILPGISGAFILVLLGSYQSVLDAVHQRDMEVILVVGAGAIVGLLSFARLLKWMFSRYKNGTLALLSGFIIGSLPKIWPWKVVLESEVFDGKEIPLPTNQEYRQVDLRALEMRAKIVAGRDSIAYFPPGTNTPSDLRYFASLDERNTVAYDQVELTWLAACMGRLYFQVPGGIQ